MKVGDRVKILCESYKEVEKGKVYRLESEPDTNGYCLVMGYLFKITELELTTETPKRYATDSIDVIDFCDLYKLDFLQGNVVKYTCRAGKKQYDNLTIEESEIKDYEKAIDYLQRKIKTLRKFG